MPNLEDIPDAEEKIPTLTPAEKLSPEAREYRILLRECLHDCVTRIHDTSHPRDKGDEYMDEIMGTPTARIQISTHKHIYVYACQPHAFVRDIALLQQIDGDTVPLLDECVAHTFEQADIKLCDIEINDASRHSDTKVVMH